MARPSAPGGAEFEPPLWEQMSAPRDGERLQKTLARAGLGSRRMCEEFISDGRVTVNGEVAVLGRRIDPEKDVVCLDDIPVGVRPGLVYYLVNKPVGVVCTSKDTHGRETIIDLVPSQPRVFSVGRLDQDSEGLIILTNDGQFANALSHPSKGVEKEYLVRVDSHGRAIGNSTLASLRQGVELEDGRTSPAEVHLVDTGVLRFVIHEGRNRQIRRMCSALGLTVTQLVRVRIGSLRDQRLKPRTFRELTSDEVRSLMILTGGESSSAEASAVDFESDD